MIYARDANQTSDSLDTGDEVGVIDLWCMLRVDAKLIPLINKAMAQVCLIFHISCDRCRFKGKNRALPQVFTAIRVDNSGHVFLNIYLVHSHVTDI